jgi:hypothetical protein
VSLRDTPIFLRYAVPPVKLAGYCQRSLRDRGWVSAAATGLGPGGTSDNSPAFPTPGRSPTHGTRVPEGRLKPRRESFPTHVAGRFRRCEIPATGCSPIWRLIAYGLVIVVKVQVSLRDTAVFLGRGLPPVNWRAIIIGPSGTGDGLAPLQRVSVPEGPLTIARRFQRRVDAHTRHRVPEGRLKPRRESFPTHVAGRFRRCEIPATGCSPSAGSSPTGWSSSLRVQVSLRDTVASRGPAIPPVKLAGYCQRSLRDLSRRHARTIPSNPLLPFITERRSRRDRLTIARRFQRRVDAHLRHRVPEGRLKPHHKPLSPDIPRIVIHIVFLQKRNELFLKTAFSMMLGLRPNVRNRIGLL